MTFQFSWKLQFKNNTCKVA